MVVEVSGNYWAIYDAFPAKNDRNSLYFSLVLVLEQGIKEFSFLNQKIVSFPLLYLTLQVPAL